MLFGDFHKSKKPRDASEAFKILNRNLEILAAFIKQVNVILAYPHLYLFDIPQSRFLRWHSKAFIICY